MYFTRSFARLRHALRSVVGLIAFSLIGTGPLTGAEDTSAGPAVQLSAEDAQLVAEVHAGDIATQTFTQFRAAVLANTLSVTSSKVDYRFGSPQERIEMYKYVAASPQAFIPPLIDGAAIHLRPSASNPLKTYDSPYLSMAYGEDVVKVSLPGYPVQELRFDTLVLLPSDPK